MEAKTRGTRREKKAVEAFASLQRANAAVLTRMFRMKAFGALSPSQFGVLEALFHGGPMSQHDLCGKIFRSSGNMVLVIDNLEKRGFVKREDYEKDRRVKLVVLTESGRKTVSALLDDHSRAVVEAVAPLNDQQIDSLTELAALLGELGACQAV